MQIDNEKKNSLYLIDSYSFIYRAYYAITDLSNSKGLLTNAIFGFTKMLLKIIQEERPDYCVSVFDVKGPTFRQKVFEEYKIHRPPMPEDLQQQIPYIKDIVKAHNIAIMELSGYEADDIIGTICERARDRFKVWVVTDDKDAIQLVSDHVRVLRMRNERYVYDRDKVFNRYGVQPEQFIDLLALMGDKADNIPGVPGIGEKRASALLKEFGNLDTILNNINKINQNSLKENLTKHIEQAKLSKHLATIVRDVPIEYDWEDFRVGEPNKEVLRDIFKEMEFSSLLKSVAPTEKKIQKKYQIINDPKAFESLIKELQESSLLSIDLETTDIQPMQARIVGISLSLRENEAYYIPLRHRAEDGSLVKQLDPEYVLQGLKPILEDPAIKKCGQNIKYDLICMRNDAGIEIKGISFDTMIASYLLNPTKHNHNLEQISLEYLNHKPISYKDVVGVGKQEKCFDRVNIHNACEYSGEDADLAFLLTKILQPKIESEGLTSLFFELELPLMEVLAGMERHGVLIDTKLLKSMANEVGEKLNVLTDQAYILAGEKFNLDSPKQLSAILFEKLGLPTVKKTKTGLSTNVDVLMQLAPMHKLPEILLEYRQLKKLKSGYVDALPTLTNPQTGRIHTSFNQTVTATGRLSSSSPNLQNIPIRTPIGRRIREAFIADKGNILLSADYSQIELRIMAHLSQDAILMESIRCDEDIHARTASEIFDKDPKDVTPELRRRAKTINFGIIYGMSAFGLARDLGVKRNQAQEYINNYFNRYRGIKYYIENCLKQAREVGYVSTLFNHRRFIQGLDAKNRTVRELAERMAVNTPIQGSAADLIKQAMINLWKRLCSECPTTKMILQIHDELLFELPESELDFVASVVREEMEGALTLSVPIKVEISSGKSWAEAH
ncbi:MAG: DNA polymerase I [bacterium]